MIKTAAAAHYALTIVLVLLPAVGSTENIEASDVRADHGVDGRAVEIESTAIYPTLEERELGEVRVDSQGESVIWGRPLPFMAQNVIDLGFDLPNPFGIAIIPNWVKQDMVLENLSIAGPDGEFVPVDFINFDRPESENYGAQLKLDAWVLPFLNVYTTIGRLNGDARVPVSIAGADLFPTLCSVTPNQPKCTRTFSRVASPNYHGTNISLGMNLAMGWDRYFVTLPITYVWSDVNIVDNTVNALNISPRFGFTAEMGNASILAVFLGANYLDADFDLEGDISLDTAEGPGPDSVSISYRIRQRNRDQWNYLLGFNWELNKSWSVTGEAGIGGSREHFISALTYRF